MNRLFQLSAAYLSRTILSSICAKRQVERFICMRYCIFGATMAMFLSLDTYSMLIRSTMLMVSVNAARGRPGRWTDEAMTIVNFQRRPPSGGVVN